MVTQAVLSTTEPAAISPDAPVVAVVGLGYVGLPTALGFHRAGYRVIGIDSSADRLETVSLGCPDISPGDADELGRARLDRDGFVVTTNSAAMQDADIVIVSVPTPVDEFLSPDLCPLRTACDQIVRFARADQTVILTSTSYVGCTRDLIEKPLRDRGLVPGESIFVCFSPERIDPGNASYEPSAVPRLVSGATADCAARAAAALAPVCGGVHLVSSLEAAELAKLWENTFRAVNIALANEMADAARYLGVDPIEVITAAATKPFGFMPFYPGPGVGGHCIPCDPHYLLWQLRRARIHPAVISAAMQSISMRPHRIVERAAEVLEDGGHALRGSRVLVAGVTYKPDVSDIRESPAIEIIAGLVRRGGEVTLYDPLVEMIDVAGRTYRCLTRVEMSDYDLVIVCSKHKVMNAADFGDARLVLDATYRLPATPNRAVP